LSKHDLYIGIDGGGSKCRATIMTADLQTLGTGTAGPANPFQNAQQTRESISAAAERALADAGLAGMQLKQLIAGVGLAGVNVAGVYQLMNSWEHPFKRMHLTTDLRIACLAAHNRPQGAVIIAGTGSCGYALLDQRELCVGGHGFPLGDKGSGAWLGLAAVKAVLLAADGLGPSSSLSDRISELLQARGIALVEKLCGASASDYAKLAVLVLDAAEAGDSVALQILSEGASYLSRLGHKLWAANPGRLSLIGGLALRLLPWLDPELVAHLSPALFPPEVGAVVYAQHCQQTGE